VRGLAVIAIAVLVAVAAAGALYILVLSRPPASGPLRVFAEGLDFPVAIAFTPDGRVFFAERLTGNIRVIENGVVLATPFFSLPGTGQGAEQGLLGLAVDPDFTSSPYVYAYQTFHDTANGTDYNRIAKITASGNRGTAVSFILSNIPAGLTHNGGIIAFGLDRKLYVALGDAQPTPTMPYPSQDLLVLNGKTLRMNPDGSAPSDNPFYGRTDANPLIFTYGHRNLFGLAFHPASGSIFVTENSQNVNDEVNVLSEGGNYGWPLVTGDANTPPYIDPIWTYPSPIAPTNAAVFNDSSVPELYGDLIFGDFNTGSLRQLNLAPPGYESVVSENILLTAPDSEAIIDVEFLNGVIWFTTQTRVYTYTPSSSGASSAAFVASPMTPLVLMSPRTAPAPDVPVPRVR